MSLSGNGCHGVSSHAGQVFLRHAALASALQGVGSHQAVTVPTRSF